MTNKEHINLFTATDIEKYRMGQLTSKQRHDLEKAALDDPFLADALEGYTGIAVNLDDDMVELKKRLADRIEKNEQVPVLPVIRNSFYWLKIAAMLILIAGAGLLVYQLGFNKRSTSISEIRPKETTKQTNKGSTAKDSMAFPNSADNSNYSVPDKEPEVSVTDKKKESTLPGTESKQSANGLIQSEKNLATKEAEAAATPVPSTGETQKITLLQKKDNPLGDISLQKSDDRVRTEEAKARKQFSQAEVSNNVAPQLKPISPTLGYSKQPAASQNFYTPPNVFRGRVTDANNNALPFTNITNLEDSVGTYSDARGYFNLTSPDSVLMVQVRSLGFESNNVQLRNIKTENNILLEEDKTLNAKILDTVKHNTLRARSNTLVLEEPEPVDGWSNYDLYLVNNLKVPEATYTRRSRGEVELSFEVDKNGAPVNITVKKSLCDSCDKEAIRLVKDGPKWKRKIKKGKATVTVSF